MQRRCRSRHVAHYHRQPVIYLFPSADLYMSSTFGAKHSNRLLQYLLWPLVRSKHLLDCFSYKTQG